MDETNIILLAGCFLGFLYSLAKGAYAIMRPTAWLRTKWTVTRGVEPGDEFAVRWVLGPIFLAVAGVWGWGTLLAISKILNRVELILCSQ
jgi:hypothetical protein